MRQDNEVHTDMRSGDSSPHSAKHKPNRTELRAGGGVHLMVDRMTHGRLPSPGDTAIVSDGKGNRYWCRRVRSLTAAWLEVDAFDWLDGLGWDFVPVKRRETLEQIDIAMKEAGL